MTWRFAVDVLQSIYLTGSVIALALASGLNRKQVRVAHKVGAGTWLSRQATLLQQLRTEFGPTATRVLCFVDRMEADATKHRLKVKSHPLLSAVQQRSAWELIVVLWEVQWVDGNHNFHTYDLVLVPAIGAGTVNARCYWDAIFEQPINSEAVEFVTYMRRGSPRSASIREPDSASTMFRVFCAEMWFQSVPNNIKCLLYFSFIMFDP